MENATNLTPLSKVDTSNLLNNFSFSVRGSEIEIKIPRKVRAEYTKI